MKLNRLFPRINLDGQVLVLGELLLDFLPGEDNMGLKDPGTVIKTVSGSSGIYACAAATLGLPAGFIGRLGADPFSELAREKLSSYNVSTEHISIDKEGKLGLAFLEYTPTGRNYAYYRDDSVGSRLSPEEIPPEAFLDASIFHFPGMLLELSESMQKSCLRALKLAKDAGVLISFDPNLRKEMAGSKEAISRIIDVIKQSDIIEPTLEEGRIITGFTNPKDVAKALLELGPKAVFLTRDKEGALLITTDGFYSVPGIDIPVTDPTGAGDTFAAAVAYSIIRGLNPEEALAFCNCTATLACLKKGAIGSAPTEDEVYNYIKKTGCSANQVD